MPAVLGHTSRLWRSILTPVAPSPLRLLATSSEYPDGVHVPTALDPLHLRIRAHGASPRAQAVLANPPPRP